MTNPKKTPGKRARIAPAPAELPKPGIEAFQTRAKANEGQKIPLYTADGILTAHWLKVRGVDSDTFRRAQHIQTRRIAEIAAMPEDERETAIVEASLEMLTALVAEWSFDEPFTHEKVKEFLREAPQIAMEIDKFASRRAFFFKTHSQNLLPTPSPSSV